MRLVSRLAAILVLSISVTALSGCLYSKVKTPLDTNVNRTELGSKLGRASFQSFLWLFATGDASVAAAAKDGLIKEITHLDVEREIVFFGLYAKQTTIAYGN